MPNPVLITLWNTLYDIDGAVQAEFQFSTWPGHVVVPAKKKPPGFGPYVLKPPALTCMNHGGIPRSGPHRCDECVKEMTLLVFDVDQGTEADAKRTDDLLQAQGIGRLWHSTFSHSITKPSYRLIIPLLRPIAPEHYTHVRLVVLRQFQIAADMVACSGKSHFYFMPSRPPWGIPPVTRWTDGRPYDAATALELAAPIIPRRPVAQLPEDWEPPDDPKASVPQKVLRAELEHRLSRMSKDRSDGQRAIYLQRLLAGEQLDTPGHRNVATLKTTGLIAYALPMAQWSDLLTLMKPSMDAMIADNTSVTEEMMKRMLKKAMRSKREADDAKEDIERHAAETAAKAWKDLA